MIKLDGFIRRYAALINGATPEGGRRRNPLSASLMNLVWKWDGCEMRLSALFSDGMILQRGCRNYLWGQAQKYEKISGKFGGKGFEACADGDGYFEAVLPDLPVGGPYQLSLCGCEEKNIEDIYMGDVFLLGGQSNMELPLNRTLDLFGEELKDLNDPLIRQFEVPKEYMFGSKRQEVEHGEWKRAVGDEGLSFSAVGFFMAKALREIHNVPIGLIQCAVGGTPIEAWCSEESLKRAGLCFEELELCKCEDYITFVSEMESAREESWHQRARQDIETVLKFDGRVIVPGIWKNNELADFCGSILLEKKISLSKEQSRQGAKLVLGAMVDADTVYINGVQVGETGYKYPPRRYKLPPGVLREGENCVQIRLTVAREQGGFVPGKHYRIELEGGDAISLEGFWDYSILKRLEYLPQQTFFQYKAAGLFNGMIYPLRKWNVSGYLFYQGESNTDKPSGYCNLMRLMVEDWRSLRPKQEIPFIYVQLSGFLESWREPEISNWARLREQQRLALGIPNSVMVVSFDVGEYNDLHPQDKRTVGRRLALAARRLVYSEDVECAGPMVEQVIREGEFIRISFSHACGGLCTRESLTGGVTFNSINLFEVCGQCGEFKPANAVIEGDCVMLYVGTDEKIIKIRYAWQDFPCAANLYNLQGLPASPFMADVAE